MNSNTAEEETFNSIKIQNEEKYHHSILENSHEKQLLDIIQNVDNHQKHTFLKTLYSEWRSILSCSKCDKVLQEHSVAFSCGHKYCRECNTSSSCNSCQNEGFEDSTKLRNFSGALNIIDELNSNFNADAVLYGFLKMLTVPHVFHEMHTDNSSSPLTLNDSSVMSKQSLSPKKKKQAVKIRSIKSKSKNNNTEMSYPIETDSECLFRDFCVDKQNKIANNEINKKNKTISYLELQPSVTGSVHKSTPTRKNNIRKRKINDDLSNITTNDVISPVNSLEKSRKITKKLKTKHDLSNEKLTLIDYFNNSGNRSEKIKSNGRRISDRIRLKIINEDKGEEGTFFGFTHTDLNKSYNKFNIFVRFLKKYNSLHPSCSKQVNLQIIHEKDKINDLLLTTGGEVVASTVETEKNNQIKNSVLIHSENSKIMNFKHDTTNVLKISDDVKVKIGNCPKNPESITRLNEDFLNIKQEIALSPNEEKKDNIRNYHTIPTYADTEDALDINIFWNEQVTKPTKSKKKFLFRPVKDRNKNLSPVSNLEKVKIQSQNNEDKNSFNKENNCEEITKNKAVINNNDPEPNQLEINSINEIADDRHLSVDINKNETSKQILIRNKNEDVKIISYREKSPTDKIEISVENSCRLELSNTPIINKENNNEEIMNTINNSSNIMNLESNTITDNNNYPKLNNCEMNSINEIMDDRNSLAVVNKSEPSIQVFQTNNNEKCHTEKIHERIENSNILVSELESPPVVNLENTETNNDNLRQIVDPKESAKTTCETIKNISSNNNTENSIFSTNIVTENSNMDRSEERSTVDLSSTQNDFFDEETIKKNMINPECFEKSHAKETRSVLSPQNDNLINPVDEDNILFDEAEMSNIVEEFENVRKIKRKKANDDLRKTIKDQSEKTLNSIKKNFHITSPQQLLIEKSKRNNSLSDFNVSAAKLDKTIVTETVQNEIYTPNTKNSKSVTNVLNKTQNSHSHYDEILTVPYSSDTKTVSTQTTSDLHIALLMQEFPNLFKKSTIDGLPLSLYDTPVGSATLENVRTPNLTLSNTNGRFTQVSSITTSEKKLLNESDFINQSILCVSRSSPCSSVKTIISPNNEKMCTPLLNNSVKQYDDSLVMDSVIMTHRADIEKNSRYAVAIGNMRDKISRIEINDNIVQDDINESKIFSSEPTSAVKLSVVSQEIDFTENKSRNSSLNKVEVTKNSIDKESDCVTTSDNIELVSPKKPFYNNYENKCNGVEEEIVDDDVDYVLGTPTTFSKRCIDNPDVDEVRSEFINANNVDHLHETMLNSDSDAIFEKSVAKNLFDKSAIVFTEISEGKTEPETSQTKISSKNNNLKHPFNRQSNELFGTYSTCCASVTLYITTSGLKENEMRIVQLFCNKFSAIMLDKLSDKTTHLIVRTDENNCTNRTFKYLQAVVNCIRIISIGWLQECLNSNKIVNEEKFIPLDSSGENGPLRAYKMTKGAVSSSLEWLNQYCIFFIEPLPAGCTLSQMQELMLKAGATVVDTIEDLKKYPTHHRIIIINEENENVDIVSEEIAVWLQTYHAVAIEFNWLIEVIGRNRLVPFADYEIVEISSELLLQLNFPAEMLQDETEIHSD